MDLGGPPIRHHAPNPLRLLHPLPSHRQTGQAVQQRQRHRRLHDREHLPAWICRRSDLHRSVSEIYGRKPVLTTGNAFFCVWQTGCALAPDIETLIVSRFFSSVGGAACLAAVFHPAFFEHIRH